MRMLFIGGPKHGQMFDVEDGENQIRVPVPADISRGAEGVPLLGQTVTYVRRTLRAQDHRTGAQYARSVMVDAQLQPQMASILLGELLTMLWILDEPEASEHPEADDATD